MLRTEARWLRRELARLSVEQLSPVLSIGSGDEAFRAETQPWIAEEVFDPLVARGVEVVHHEHFPRQASMPPATSQIRRSSRRSARSSPDRSCGAACLSISPTGTRSHVGCRARSGRGGSSWSRFPGVFPTTPTRSTRCTVPLSQSCKLPARTSRSGRARTFRAAHCSTTSSRRRTRLGAPVVASGGSRVVVPPTHRRRNR